MEEENELSKALVIAGLRAQYDANVKQILSNKSILAWILKYSCEEAGSYSIPEIQTFIEDDVKVSSVSVLPGETNETYKQTSDNELIKGLNTENAFNKEGKITFDVLFEVTIPGLETRTMFINIEAQRDFYPGYCIEERGIFYSAREISSQLGRVFQDPDYHQLRKVYSIWICPNSPVTEGNTLSAYSMQQRNLIGHHRCRGRYDLMEVVVIGVPEKGEDTDGIHGMLRTLLSHRILPTEKKRLLTERYHIPVTRKLREELIGMCNLSIGIEEEGLEKGLIRGREEGLVRGREEGQIKERIQMSLELGLEKNQIIAALMDKFHLSKDDAEMNYEKYAQ